jgi:hypothetical protein
MEIQGCDRRILKAFYTQYVAVLLIILTFTIGAFQRAVSLPVVSSSVQSQHSELAPIGEFALAGVFAEDGSVRKDNERLRAISDVVKNHDVVLHVALAAPRLEFAPDAAALRRALRRIQSLEQFFVQEEVALSSVHFRVSRDGGDANAVTVRLVPEREGANDVRF